MTAGLQVFNDDNIIQIDDEYSNLRFISKGSFVAENGLNSITVSNAHLPILALRVTSTSEDRGYAAQEAVRASGSTWVFDLRVGIEFLNNQVTVEYWIFDKGDPSPSGFGLQTFSSNGGLVFDSNEKYFKCVENIKVNNWTTETWQGVKSYETGHTYAAVSGQFGGQWRGTAIPPNPPQPGIYRQNNDGPAVFATTVPGAVRVGIGTVFSMQQTGATGPVGTVIFPALSMMILDVTDI